MERIMKSRAVTITLMTCAGILSPQALIANDVDLTFLQGHWCMKAGNKQIEEYWLSPAEGESVGIGRTLTDGKMTSFEYMRINGRGASMSYTAQPGGSEATHFSATGSGSNWLAFENPRHDFPQKIEYSREGDTLKASISGPGEEGKEMAFVFEYQRCP
jgi:hypothetical protein